MQSNAYPQLYELSRDRFSCRAYSSRPVDRDTLLAVMDVARLAPSACNKQPWMFLIADSDELRNAINVVFPGVFTQDGKLDRQKLGKEVFAQRDRLSRLNDIVFRFVVPEVRRRLGSGSGLYAVDAINLLESGLTELCDCTIAVTAPTELRVRRIMARDHISEQYARMRVTAQKSDEYYRAKCTYELANAGEDQEAFRKETREFFRRLIEAIKEEKARGKE